MQWLIENIKSCRGRKIRLGHFPRLGNEGSVVRKQKEAKINSSLLHRSYGKHIWKSDVRGNN